MGRITRRPGLGLALLLFVATPLVAPKPAPAQESPAGVHIGGAVPAPSDWTVAQIKSRLADQVRPVNYVSGGHRHTADCVPLLSLLKAAGLETDLKMDPKNDPKTKNRPLRLVIVVRASDGYTVVFSLPELLPDIGNREVEVALDADGQPLSSRDGPVRLLVPADKKPGRQVHGVTEINVLDASAETGR